MLDTQQPEDPTLWGILYEIGYNILMFLAGCCLAGLVFALFFGSSKE